MRSLILSLLSIPCFLMLTSSSCKHNDDNVSPGNNGNINGNWIVSYYWDNTKDETSDFNRYIFTFTSNGSMTATRNGATISGSWSMTTDDSKQKFIITLSTSDIKLSKLNDDWIIISQTSSLIKLQDDNSSKNEQLYFSRQ